MGKGERTNRRPSAVPSLPDVIREGRHVRIVTEEKTAVVILGAGPDIIVEMDDGTGPRVIPRWDIELIDRTR